MRSAGSMSRPGFRNSWFKAFLSLFVVLGLIQADLQSQTIRERIRERRQARRQSGQGDSTRQGEPAQVSGATSCGGQLNVGFQIVQFKSGLKAGAWYPTTNAEQTYDYANGLATALAINAPVADCERYPVVVFSHGFGGCGTQSAFITEGMARAGYVVIAPDHRDSKCKVDQPRQGRMRFERAEVPFRDPERWTDKTYIDRRDDIRTVLDQMPGMQPFSGHVDTNRIAGAGHSLGGYTMMGMGGGWDNWEDSRIKALLLLSPYGAPFLSHNRVRDINVPVMFQGGERDRGITPYLRKSGGVYDQARKPKYYLELKDQGHLDWTVAACRGAASIDSCVNSSEKLRVTTDESITFLNRYLKGEDRRGAAASLGDTRRRDSSAIADFRSETD